MKIIQRGQNTMANTGMRRHYNSQLLSMYFQTKREERERERTGAQNQFSELLGHIRVCSLPAFGALTHTHGCVRKPAGRHRMLVSGRHRMLVSGRHRTLVSGLHRALTSCTAQTSAIRCHCDRVNSEPRSQLHLII